MTRRRWESVSAPRAWAEPVSSDRIVVLAASAGGLAALREVLGAIPAELPAAIVVVQHGGDKEHGLLVPLLQRATKLRVRLAEDGDLLEPGTVYVCPAGTHAVAEHCLRLVDGPRLDHVRPSADVMLRSAASAYGDRAIGIVLSGDGADGTLGAYAVAEAGGVVIAQDPGTSAHPSMPTATIDRGRAERVLPVAEIGPAVCDLLGGPRVERSAEPFPASTPAIRVLVADDHRIILDGLRALLETEPDMVVVGEAEDGATALSLARELVPDVVVMDVSMPGTDGIEATRSIRAALASTQVVILTAYVDAKRMVEVLEAGAIGFLAKDAAYADLAAAVRAAAAGRPFFSARVAALAARPHNPIFPARR